VTDGAEQTEDGVVTFAEMKVGNVRFVGLTNRVLCPSDSDKRRIEVETVHLQSVIGCEEMRMFARTAGNVQYRATVRMDPTEEQGDITSFLGVVLEARVDQIVELCRFAEHVGATV